MEKIKEYLFSQMKEQKLSKEKSKLYLEELYSLESQTKTSKDMAVIGMSCRFAGADNLEEYWDLLHRGRCSIGEFPSGRRIDTDQFLSEESLASENRYRVGGYLPEIDKFDPAAFRISPKEAELMDPRQRLFLEVAWSALEDAGYGGQRLYGSNTGVFVGMDTTGSLGYSFLSDDNEMEGTGSVTCILARRLSYILNLSGPSMVMDTACSSALVALHTASRAIQDGDCEFALIGGVNVLFLPSKGGLLDSPDRELRAFDYRANGTVWGEGMGAILICPLEKAIEEGCDIYAVIKGTGVNNDGASNGLTAPSAEAQAEMLCKTWETAGINPETISYIEAHGTGTRVGDPIELRGLTKAFQRYTDKRQFCGIGSVKTNIGHTNGTSGIASLIKVILSIRHKQIPPTLKFERPNPLIDFSDSPIYVNNRLQQWDNNHGVPRRAGVSSFGFSGTNCHVVVEEAPELYRGELVSNENRLFTLSGKNDTQLMEYITRYLYHLDANPEVKIEDICYTNHLGRNHAASRLALLVKDTTELKETLEIIREIGLEKVTVQPGCFFKSGASVEGESRLAIDERKLMLTSHADELIRKTSEEKRDEATISNICALYVQGADPNWQLFYDDQKFGLIHLPTYPYEKKRFWVQTNKASEGVDASGSSSQRLRELHPLLDECITNSVHEKIYKTEFRTDKQWVLREHKIDGQCVVPGTTYMEMALQAGISFGGSDMRVIKGVQFYEPLVVAEGKPVTVQTIIRREGERTTFTVASQSTDQASDSGWIKHASGVLDTLLQETKGHSVDLQEVLSQMKETIDVPIKENVGVFTFGPRWQSLKKIYNGSDVTVALLQLNDYHAADLNVYSLHPSLLDISVGAGFVQLPSDGLYLPFGYEELNAYGKIPANCYSIIHYKKGKTEQTEIVKFDITITDILGNIVVKVTDFALKKVNNLYKTLHQSRNKKAMYQINWRALESAPSVPINDRKKTLLWSGKSELSEELHRLIQVNSSIVERWDSYEALEMETSRDHLITINEDFLTEIKQSHIDRIIFMVDGETDDNLKDNFDTFKKGVYTSLFTFFGFVKALASARVRRELEIVVVTKNAYAVNSEERVIHPGGAAVAGLCKVVQQEFPNLLCKTIDVDGSNSVQKLYEVILDPLETSNIAIRHNCKYVQILGVLNSTDQQETLFEPRENGVYLITGGTSGIGLESAKALASAGKPINLILMHRSNFPYSLEWSDIVENSKDLKLVSKIRTLQEIEASGSSISLYQCDVSDAKSMQDTFQIIRETYSEINGVIHSAGIAGDGFIMRKSIEEFEKVINPKIFGTWLLDHLTAEDPLDFFVLYSSVASLLGSMGQSDYTAANAFLDSFAQMRHVTNKHAMSINWAAWKETGMAVDYGANEDSIFKAIETRDGTHFLLSLLQCEPVNVIVGELNFEHELFANLNVPLPIRLSSEIIGEAQKKLFIPNQAENGNQVGVILFGREDGRYSPTELLVGGIWSKYLGMDQISIFEDFYKIGGDSIQVIKIVNELNEIIPHKLDVSDMFEHPTIFEFSQYIVKMTGEVQKDIVEEGIVELEPDTYVLSSAQRRIWFLHKLNPELTAYHLPMTLKLEWEMEIDILNRALKRLIQRQSALRTVVIEDQGIPKQQILQDMEYTIQCVDLTNNPEPEAKMEQLVREETNRPFLFAERMFRIKTFKLGDAHYQIYVSLHHLIADGWSYRMFMEDLFTYYETEKMGIEIRDQLDVPPYHEWIVNQEEWKQSDEYLKSEQYWLEELGTNIPVLELPIDFSRPKVQTYNGSSLEFIINEEVTAKLKELARSMNSTMHMLLLAIYSSMLRKLSGSDELIIGSPYSGRDDRKFEKTIGLFMNTVCNRIHVSPEETFQELVQRVKEVSIRSYRHGNYPFSDLVEKINPERDMGRNPIYSTFFQYYENSPFKQEGISQHELAMHCKEETGHILARFEYNTDLFRHTTIHRFELYFKEIIYSILSNPQILNKHLEMVPAQEKVWMSSQLHGKCESFASIPVHQQFENIVAAVPHALAVANETSHLTYHELNIKCNQLAHQLLSMGVQKNHCVAVIMTRGFSSLQAILSILKSGGTYVPIDPSLPLARIAYMIDHSGSNIIIAERQWLERTSEWKNQWKNRNVVQFESFEQLANNFQPENPNIDVNIEQIMYVTYTSGSTGKPKGVMVSHGNVANFLNWASSSNYISANDRILSVTSTSFDISVFEMFGPLTSGAQLIFASDSILLEPKKLLHFIVQREITLWHSVPALITMWLGELEGGTRRLLPSINLRTIMVGGEAWSGKLAARIFGLFPTVQLINMYGPTETTIWITSHNVLPEEESKAIVPIGKPISNNELVIKDSDGQACPIGVSGELYIKGASVSRGYFDDVAKTEQAFVRDEFDDILYKTGDICKLSQEGTIEYIGRKDSMVKLRGYRIDIGEIESLLLSMDMVSQCAVVLIGQGDSAQLVSCIVPTHAYSEEACQERLEEWLPGYMIPSHFISLSNLPLLNNGKLDRKELTSVCLSAISQRFHSTEEESTEMESEIMGIWKDILNIGQIGLNTNFFHSGGNSLQVAQLHARLDRIYPGRLEIVDFFKYPTISKLATYMANRKQRQTDNDASVTQKQPDKDRMKHLLSAASAGTLSIDEVLENLKGMKHQYE